MSTVVEKDWQTVLREAVTEPEVLFARLQLDASHLAGARLGASLFSLWLPETLLDRIVPGDIHDPVLQQFLPVADEANHVSGFGDDPLYETQFNPVPGLLHKYKSRVLITVGPKCAVNCRYCFRRTFDYKNNTPGTPGFAEIVDYIKQDTRIHEVIYSGGDPLVLPDQYLQQITEQIAAIDHVKTLRIHTRLPIAIPQRITSSFCEAITNTRLQVVVVLHSNHPNEINTTVGNACDVLKKYNVVLLNQSVLLKNINDDKDVLVRLSEKLFECGVLPYYLHLLDRVSGTAHFEVCETRAKQLHQQLMSELPGYLVPKLVREQASAESKLNVAPLERLDPA